MTHNIIVVTQCYYDMFCSLIGLGMKTISFFQHGDSDDVHFGIIEEFPQLGGMSY